MLFNFILVYIFLVHEREYEQIGHGRQRAPETRPQQDHEPEQQEPEQRQSQPTRQQHVIESVEPQDAQQQFTVRVTNSLQNACTSIELTPKYLVLSVMTFINTHIDLIRNYVQQHARSNVKIQVYVCAQFRQVQDAQGKSKLHHLTSAKAVEEDLATF